MKHLNSGGFFSVLGSGTKTVLTAGLFLSLTLSPALRAQAPGVVDPGVRGGTAGGGAFVSDPTAAQAVEFPDFTAAFKRVVGVPTTPGQKGGGLGPRFNSNSCASCHAVPAAGGSSPGNNPLFSIYKLDGAHNTMPAFIHTLGPILNARFPFKSDLKTRDGRIHQLFTIAGRADAGTCGIAQPAFATAAAQNNLALRQPIPLYGDGMIDTIDDAAILANLNANQTLKQQLGISGHPNIDNNSGAITRFGWKAQVQSLLTMASLEQQVQKGVTNEFFPNEMDETPGCVLNGVPEDGNNYDVTTSANPAKDQFTGDGQLASLFVRFLDQPKPTVVLGQTNGQVQFNNIGCSLCHTQTFVTPASTILDNDISVNLFSDLLVHNMGPCLADNIIQGTAKGDEFRTAPLWNVGQRHFFMHDGRTANIIQAIEAHSCAGNAQFGPSEANAVIAAFNALSAANQQDLVTFLRNL